MCLFYTQKIFRGVNMLNKNDVEKLYLRYGFEIGETNDSYLVFISKNGYFKNAEIIILDDRIPEKKLPKETYEALGYSVRISSFKSLLEIHDSLFNGFFNTSFANKKINLEYDDFCKQQNQKLSNCHYEYISGNYLENGNIRNDNIICRINELFADEEKQLMILEASAGYGKTCTSFEVIHQLTKSSPDKIPLITELSKNRKASIFRYVLLSEIDQKFPSLSSELVISEINNGRVLLIIDGFDELLSKSYNTSQEKDKNSKDAQTMLDTIAQLFAANSKTKVLLTTRKSSIFVGAEFDDWVEKHLKECNITRFQLQEPSLKDWIGNSKIEILKKNNINIDNISNPVLLTLLRNTPLDEFEKVFTSNDEVIKQYLSLLLNREQGRQSLVLTNAEQISIISKLAGQMVQYDISAEETEFIKEMLREIIGDDIHIYLDRYNSVPFSSEDKPSESEFLTKLSHHALLDRVSMQSNLIGFINDFIFGYMIGICIINNHLPSNELQGKYFDILITAYASCSSEKRTELYNKIAPAFCNISAQQQVNASIFLLDEIHGNYCGEYFDSVEFKKFKIVDYHLFNNCIFNDCTFDSCILNTDAFNVCHFYNCTFFDNTIENGDTLNCELVFLGCTGYSEFANAAYRSDNSENYPENCCVDFERTVLEQFWKPGYEMAEPYRKFQVLIKGISSKYTPKIESAIESLVRKEILIKRMRVYELNFNKIDEIKAIIKR